jgi:hypothetical protein
MRQRRRSVDDTQPRGTSPDGLLERDASTEDLHTALLISSLRPSSQISSLLLENRSSGYFAERIDVRTNLATSLALVFDGSLGRTTGGHQSLFIFPCLLGKSGSARYGMR